MQSAVMQLIQDYISVVRHHVNQLKEKYGEVDILRGRRRGVVPATGILDEVEKTAFVLHGVGCCITGPLYEVDFDFAEGGRCDGFDAWRLWNFAQSRKGSRVKVE